MSLFSVRVARKFSAAKEVSGFELVPLAGQTLPAFAAGAHIDVETSPGIVRQYSICNAPHETDRYTIAVSRENASRGGSFAMVDRIEEGATLKISKPRNLFALAPGNKSARLFAGGIGITPILAMAHQLTDALVPFQLHYAGGSRDRMAFVDQIMTSTFANSVILRVDDESEETLDLEAAVADRQGGEHLYVCGPAGFIAAVTSAATAADWPADHIHREHFAPSDEIGVRDAFRVTLARSRLDLEIPSDRTVLDVLLEHGVQIDSSCEQGVCGTCVTRLLEGQADHRDLFLTDAEHAANDQFAPCCSRAKSSVIVLDL